jgi:hypothetical protein
VLIVGGFAGLSVGLAVYAATAVLLGISVAVLGSLGAWLVGLLTNTLFVGLTVTGWVIAVVLSIGIFYVFAYIVAALGILPGLATVPAVAPPTPFALPPSGLEMLGRGFLIGLTSALNFGLWASVPHGIVLGVALAVISLSLLAPAASRSLAVQAILGWSSWLRPMSWFATAFGLLLFVVNLPFALAMFGPAALRFDRFTSTIETTGGAVIGVTRFPGGFNLGNFTFIPLGPPRRSGGFFGPGGAIASHETGHTLGVAAFGGLYTWINAVDENVPPLRRNSFALAELTAESHFPRIGRGFGPGPGTPPPTVVIANVRVWS